MLSQDINIGDRFYKPLNKGKHALCEVSDLIKRISIKTGDCVGVEIWARPVDGSYITDNHFEVSKVTVIKNRAKV